VAAERRKADRRVEAERAAGYSAGNVDGYSQGSVDGYDQGLYEGSDACRDGRRRRGSDHARIA